MHLPSNTVVDVAYAEAEIVGDYVLTTMMSGRDVCCFYLVSWKSGAVTLVSSCCLQCYSGLHGLSFIAPAAPGHRIVKYVETVMVAETRGHRWQLDNAGELHQEQSRDLQARACLSRTALADRVLPRVTDIRTIRLCRRVQGRKRVGSNLVARRTIPTTPAETHRTLPLLQSRYNRTPRGTRNANS